MWISALARTYSSRAVIVVVIPGNDSALSQKATENEKKREQ